jgi:hypothetical protein
MVDYVINFVAIFLSMYKIKESIEKSSSILLQNLVPTKFVVRKIKYYN